ncbi:unnamed protein product [Echinostoma caproni]|uniref:SRCR domain-containing protein n=1 Tax=Echinostoma caproni TaxID=27848 RepID=A0A183A824_9TREM|nr:unnamed protein product [Echinostoma caproni]
MHQRTANLWVLAGVHGGARRHSLCEAEVDQLIEWTNEDCTLCLETLRLKLKDEYDRELEPPTFSYRSRSRDLSVCRRSRIVTVGHHVRWQAGVDVGEAVVVCLA